MNGAESLGVPMRVGTEVARSSGTYIHTRLPAPLGPHRMMQATFPPLPFPLPSQLYPGSHQVFMTSNNICEGLFTVGQGAEANPEA